MVVDLNGINGIISKHFFVHMNKRTEVARMPRRNSKGRHRGHVPLALKRCRLPQQRQRAQQRLSAEALEVVERMDSGDRYRWQRACGKKDSFTKQRAVEHAEERTRMCGEEIVAYPCSYAFCTLPDGESSWHVGHPPRQLQDR
jgi:hypothetical protein